MSGKSAIKGDLMMLNGNIVFNRQNPNLVAGNSMNLLSKCVYMSGDLNVKKTLIADEIVTLSDKTSKSNIKKINKNVTNSLSKLGVYTYNLKKSKNKKIGLISQEVKEIFPQCTEKKGDKLYIDYNSIISLLVKCVSELKSEINVLKKKIKKNEKSDLIMIS
jgi:hypothetical protein